jgi:hypothetical protein
VSKIPWEWNLRTVPYKSQSELDRESFWPQLKELRMDDHRERSEFISWCGRRGAVRAVS